MSENMSLQDIADVVAFMNETVTSDFLDGPFKSKPLLNPTHEFGFPTRFSTGDWPVWYSSLEDRVAIAEIAHYFQMDARSDNTERRPRHYSVVRCAFAGQVADLMSVHEQPGWEQLTSENREFCQDIGREVRDLELDGILAPSARTNGINLPVFKRSAIAQPIIMYTVRLVYDAEREQVVVESA